MFSDEHDIERELKASLEVRPSGGFEGRVLQAAGEPAQTRGLPWSWLGAAAAFMLTAGIWALSGGTLRPVPESVVTRADPAVRVEPADPEAGAADQAAERPVRIPPTPRQVSAARAAEEGREAAAPDVIVPANQLALIRAFSREIQDGRVRLSADEEIGAGPRTLVVPEMNVEPIAIAVLDPAVPAPGAKGLH